MITIPQSIWMQKNQRRLCLARHIILQWQQMYPIWEQQSLDTVKLEFLDDKSPELNIQSTLSAGNIH